MEVMKKLFHIVFLMLKSGGVMETLRNYQYCPGSITIITVRVLEDEKK